MKPTYYLLAGIAFVLLAWPQQAAAQEFTECTTTQDECVVEWASSTGEPIVNALTNTIANDTDRPAGRVYVLKRGGYYYNEEHISNSEFNLQIVGQTAEEGAATGENVCGPGANEDCGPAIIQRFQREDGSTDGLMIESSGDGNGGLTLKNLWLIGLDNTGAGSYEPITINSSNSTFVFDNVVFDRNTWHHLGFKQSGNDIFFTNCLFRNLTDGTQIWSGRAIRLEGGANTVMFENNTFFNLTSFPFQSEAEPVEYFVFNHNTLVNFGRNFNAGALWKQAYVANNVMVNPFWQGESQEQYDGRLQNWLDQGNTEADFDPFLGIFGVGALPARFGLESDRRIVLANNNWWRDPALDPVYTTHSIHPQPLVSDTTMSYFNLYEGMVMQDNLNQNPELANAPTSSEVYTQIETFIGQWVNAEPTPWELLFWDPGLQDNPLAISWPVPEDFAYTNSALMTAGTDGLPLGDLNWFPQDKETYMANRDDYIQALIDLAGGTPEEPIDNPSVEAEAGALAGGAEVQSVSADTWYTFNAGAAIEWSFEIPEEKEYMLNVHVNLAGRGQSGLDMILNGSNIFDVRGWGQYVFEPAYYSLPNNEWIEYPITQDSLNANSDGALTLPAGTNTLRIQHSWAENTQWAGVDVVDPATGDVVVALRAPDAVAQAAVPGCSEEADYCASGFQWVALGANDSVTWSLDLPSNTNSVLPQFFYVAESGGTGEVLVDGVKAADVSFSATAMDEASQLLGSRFNVSGGSHTITLNMTSGSVNLDYVFFTAYEGMTTGIEENELPEGYALEQNYPNPFNPTTNISFTMGNTGTVRLTVYDLMGRKIATLVDRQMPAGTFNVTWDATSASGMRLASGVYYYRLETPVGQQVRSMVLMK